MYKKLILASLMSFAAASAHADIAVVTSKESVTVPESSIKRIFMGRTQAIDNAKVEAVFQKAETKSRQTFDFIVLNKDPESLESGWSRLQFSGKVSYTPAQLSSDQEVIAHVLKKPNTIGYISTSSITDDLRVIQTFKHEEQ